MSRIHFRTLEEGKNRQSKYAKILKIPLNSDFVYPTSEPLFGQNIS